MKQFKNWLNYRESHKSGNNEYCTGVVFIGVVPSNGSFKESPLCGVRQNAVHIRIHFDFNIHLTCIRW